MVGGGRAQDWRVEAPKFLGARSGTVTHGICTAPNVVTTTADRSVSRMAVPAPHRTPDKVFPVSR